MREREERKRGETERNGVDQEKKGERKDEKEELSKQRRRETIEQGVRRAEIWEEIIGGK